MVKIHFLISDGRAVCKAKVQISLMPSVGSIFHLLVFSCTSLNDIDKRGNVWASNGPVCEIFVLKSLI